MIKNFILTFDYELFGDGSGDVFEHIIEPTYRLLNFCEEHGIKITLFVEILEYIKIKEEWSRGNTMGYDNNPVQAIENQICLAARAGHDIQLHIHPQWYNAHFEGNCWNLDLSNWRLGHFRGRDGYNVRDLIRDCKVELERLLQKEIPNYNCIAIRAGGYNIMPSEEVYQAIVDNGLVIESSVYPGGYEDGTLSKFDYTSVDINRDYWWADLNDVRMESSDRRELIELPLFALPLHRYRKIISWNRVKQFLLRRKVVASAVSKEKMKKTSLLQKILFLVGKESYTWDVCIFSRSLNRQFYRYIQRCLSAREYFVLIGHPKSLENDSPLQAFAEEVLKERSNIHFITVSRFYEDLIKKDSRAV